MAVAGILVVLSLEVHALRDQAAELRRRKALPYVGQVQPTVRAMSLAGDSVVMGETTPGRAQLLIFFSSSCPFCLANVPTWKRLADTLRADRAHRFDIVWVALSPADSARRWATHHGVIDPVVRFPDGKTRAVYRVKGVPITLLTDERGQIMYMHPSVFNSRAAADSLLAVAWGVGTKRATPANDSSRAAGR
jgi:hypothetical protein